MARAETSISAVVLKRGGGDCPAGCTENEYWYFESDASCAPKDAGHFHPTYGTGCVNVVGEARWGRPPAPDPAKVCGADLTPDNISGTYQLWACGTRALCSLANYHQDNLPSSCPQNLDIAAAYDFEGFAQSELEVEEAMTPDCNFPDQYCKGYVFAKLFTAAP